MRTRKLSPSGAEASQAEEAPKAILEDPFSMEGTILYSNEAFETRKYETEEKVESEEMQRTLLSMIFLAKERIYYQDPRSRKASGRCQECQSPFMLFKCLMFLQTHHLHPQTSNRKYH